MFLLIPFYLIFALIMIRYFMKRYTGQHKWRRFFLLAFLFYLPVGWDVILGRAYFYYLCNKDGGVHIYQTVELEPEYWNEDGSPRFYTERGAFDSSVFGGRYVISNSDDRYTKKVFDITKDVDEVIDVVSGKKIGEWVMYVNRGGWLMNLYNPFGQTGDRCHRSSDMPDNPSIKEVNLTTPVGVILREYAKFTSYIFLKKDANKGEMK